MIGYLYYIILLILLGAIAFCHGKLIGKIDSSMKDR